MGYEWAQVFEDGETRAACSKCGVPYRFPSELVRQNDGLFYCKRRCLEQTVLTRDRIQAQSRKRREMPPPKFVQPPQYAEDYLGSEDFIISTICRDLPRSTDPTEIGWGVRYLADMVIENERPTGWIERAKEVIAERCNYLLTLQYGYVGGPSPSTAATSIRYGGFAANSNLYTSIAIIAGAAFVKAYTILGTVLYLDAAKRCATFLRHMQCQDLDNNSQQSYYGGAAYHVGGFAEGVSSAGGGVTWITQYNVYDIAGVWFLDLLRDVVGGGTQYGEASSSDFTASTLATLNTMIDECVAFAVTGVKDSNYGGQLKTGLSATYPRATYLPSTSASTGLETWVLSASSGGAPTAILRGSDVAVALFALDAIGEGTTTVNAVFDWLMTFTPNPLNASPAQDPELLIGTLTGTYDPTIALAVELDVLDDDGVTPLATEHVGTGYSWLATGLLAPIASVRLPARFRVSKDTLSLLQPSERGPDPLPTSNNVTGFSGLDLQISEALP